MRSLFRSPTIPPGLSMCECGAGGSASCRTAFPIRSTICHLSGFTSRCIAVSPVWPGCPSLPLLLVWMNVSFLSPWLSDFCAVRFSVSSGWFFLFLNCCPSFGCARRCSVSTYTSILAASSESTSLTHPQVTHMHIKVWEALTLPFLYDMDKYGSSIHSSL